MSGVSVQAASTRAADSPPAPKADKSIPKWEADTRERVKAAVKKFQKPLADLLARDGARCGSRVHAPRGPKSGVPRVLRDGGYLRNSGRK